MRFKDKVVLITGASRGIGKATALRFAQEGAIVGINFLKSEEAALKLQKEIQLVFQKCILLPADVTDEGQVKKMVETLYQKYKHIDILVNNAGMTRDNLLLSMDEESWNIVIDTNLKSMFLLTKFVARYMMIKKYGRIINVSSIAAIRGSRGHANYAASKGGVNAFTKSMAVELSSKNITVNTVSPGVIKTEMSKDIRDVAEEDIIKRIPLKRLGEPEDVAEAILFLASSSASYITGEIINITGGMHL